MKKLNTNNIQLLIKRLHTFPVSIVLAQAAIESGWGSSRFFLQANNLFGIWSFDPKHQRIAADSTRNGTKVFLRQFDDLEQAIGNYYLLLATGKPFAAFRRARLQTNNPDTLIQALKMYSERREAYVDDLALVIRTSHLKRYDNYEIAPAFLRKEKTFRLFPEWTPNTCPPDRVSNSSQFRTAFAKALRERVVKESARRRFAPHEQKTVFLCDVLRVLGDKTLTARGGLDNLTRRTQRVFTKVHKGFSTNGGFSETLTPARLNVVRASLPEWH